MVVSKRCNSTMKFAYCTIKKNNLKEAFDILKQIF